jgi:hypothetical protein
MQDLDPFRARFPLLSSREVNMLRHPALLALLLLVIVTLGCRKAEMEEDDRPSPNLVGRLEPGVETPVRMWGRQADYVYEGTAGEVVSLSVDRATQGLDPNVQLLDPDGLPEAFDDDGGSWGNALIQKHTLASSGTYKIRLRTEEDRIGEVVVQLDVEGKGPVEGTSMITAEALTTEELPAPTPDPAANPQETPNDSTPPP